MNLVDSSGWLEYFADGDNANFFAPAVEDIKNLIVPSICLYEVFKRILQQRTEDEALRAAAVMQQGRVVSLDPALSLEAAQLSFSLKLPLADSIILATAKAFGAIIWTQDADFREMKNVRFVPAKK